MKPEQIKHLELIQGIITRMNTNSFQIKGFSIAVISGILTVYAQTLNFWMLPIGYPTIMMFWIIDSYYLQHERKYRGLYNDYVENKWEGTRYVFDMDISRFSSFKYSLICAMFVSVNSFVYILLILMFCILSSII